MRARGVEGALRESSEREGREITTSRDQGQGGGLPPTPQPISNWARILTFFSATPRLPPTPNVRDSPTRGVIEEFAQHVGSWTALDSGRRSEGRSRSRGGRISPRGRSRRDGVGGTSEDELERRWGSGGGGCRRSGEVPSGGSGGRRRHDRRHEGPAR